MFKSIAARVVGGAAAVLVLEAIDWLIVLEAIDRLEMELVITAEDGASGTTVPEKPLTGPAENLALSITATATEVRAAASSIGTTKRFAWREYFIKAGVGAGPTELALASGSVYAGGSTTLASGSAACFASTRVSVLSFAGEAWLGSNDFCDFSLSLVAKLGKSVSISEQM